MQTEVSIITVYFNSPEEILRLQESIRNHLGKRNIEWIVADNHSNVDLSKELAGSIYLRFSENLGFGKANNRASEHASAPYLFFVNPDCTFLNDCLDPLVRALATDGVAGPRVLNQDGSLQLSFGPFLTIRNELIQKSE